MEKYIIGKIIKIKNVKQKDIHNYNGGKLTRGDNVDKGYVTPIVEFKYKDKKHKIESKTLYRGDFYYDKIKIGKEVNVVKMSNYFKIKI